MENTVVALIPSIIAILFAAKTKKVFEAILIAIITGLILLYRESFLMELVNLLLEVMEDPITGWIIMITCLFGSFLAVLEKSGGARAFTDVVSRYANTEKKSLFITFILGIVLFIDEYLNVLTIGSAMKKVTDKNNVPREMLAYVINSTSTPICVLLPFSTWSIFFIGLLNQEGVLHNGTAIGAYVRIIPFILYAWITVLMVPLVIGKVIPKLGPMKNKISKVNQSTGVEEEAGGKIVNFLVPLAVVITVTLMNDVNLTVGLVAGLFVSFAMYMIQKILTFDEYMEAFWDGFKSMIVPLSIVIMAFCFKRVNEDLGLSIFILEAVKPYVISSLLPAASFIIVAALAFATGTLWGLVAIVLPIVLTLAGSFDVNVFLVAGAVFSGAVFGSHACFYSDVVVLTARATDIKPVDHAVSLLPYALIASIISITLYVILGVVGV